MLDEKKNHRQAALRAWLAYHNIAKRDLAERLGVHPSMISRIINGERAPEKRISQLIEHFGIPEALLPEPSGPPGRPKGSGKNKSD